MNLAIMYLFLFTTVSVWALGPTQSPIQQVPRPSSAVPPIGFRGPGAIEFQGPLLQQGLQ
jgi:hypothetical protein